MPTKIEYADEPWSPITGCSKISEGCKNCWAERMARRLAGRYGYPEAPHHFDVTVHEDKFDQPLRWKKPRRIFVSSMGDLFHESLETAEGWGWIGDVWQTMVEATEHTFLVLTKRPQHMKRWMLDYWVPAIDYWPPSSNIVLGVTAENQQRADERIPILLQIPAAGHFVSLEPMLSHIDISPYLPYNPIHTEVRNGAMQEQRADSLSSCSSGRARDRRPRAGLATSNQDGRQVERRKPHNSLQAPSSGARYRPVSPSACDGQLEAYSSIGAQVSLPSFLRPNSSGADDQPHQWEQERQSPGELGDSDLFRSSNARASYPGCWQSPQSMGSQECGIQANIRAGATDSATQGGRGEVDSHSAGLRHCVSDCIQDSQRRTTLSWVICGGESGPGARPTHPNWARSVRDQCGEAGVPFLFKGWGAWGPVPPERPWPPKHPWYERGPVVKVVQLSGLRSMYRVGKKAAGRLLDGREWDEYPEMEQGEKGITNER